jgi:hypothetical protein
VCHNQLGTEVYTWESNNGLHIGLNSFIICLFVCLFFGGIGLALAKQVLCHLSHVPTTFLGF